MMWRDGSDDLGHATAPIWCELRDRLEVELSERDRLAVLAAFGKATLLDYQEGFNVFRQSAVLDAALQGVELKLDGTLSISNSPDLWEAYVTDEHE
jgi:hypothetical protein